MTITHLVFSTRKGLVEVPVSEVLYFKAEDKYVTVSALSGDYLSGESLKYYESTFQHLIIRVSRSTLVSRNLELYELRRNRDTKSRTLRLIAHYTSGSLPGLLSVEVSRRQTKAVKTFVAMKSVLVKREVVVDTTEQE